MAKVRYAYPLDFFMLKAPEFDTSSFPEDVAAKIRNDFKCGIADEVPARSLVRAGIAFHYPMRGGIFWRREPVKYIVVHSTETGIPLGAKRVIDSWSSVGRRHAGAQYVVERDGTIYQAVDPDLATVHLNIFKTLPGINNDNSIGIEMVHTGKQNYPAEQRAAVIRLVAYLQDRYSVSDDNVITHRYAQQGDHTDPVAFDWDGFLRDKTRFRQIALATKLNQVNEQAGEWVAAQEKEPPLASTYLQMHGPLPLASQGDLPLTVDVAVFVPAANGLKGGVEEAAAKSNGKGSACSSPGRASVDAPGAQSDGASIDHCGEPRAAGSAPALVLASEATPLRGPIELDPKSVRALSGAAETGEVVATLPASGKAQAPRLTSRAKAVSVSSLSKSAIRKPVAAAAPAGRRQRKAIARSGDQTSRSYRSSSKVVRSKNARKRGGHHFSKHRRR